MERSTGPFLVEYPSVHAACADPNPFTPLRQRPAGYRQPFRLRLILFTQSVVMTMNAATLALPYAPSRPAHVTTAAERRSDSIAIARVICILGVVYVHAWTGVDAQTLFAMHGSGQDLLRWTLMEGFGRSAVPLLGLISGWLVAGSARTRNWWPFVRHKARTILLPMLLWNIIALLIICSAAAFLGLRAPVPPSFEWVAQELLILTRNPDVNVQMPFLRDLFLCMVAAPLLVRLPTAALAAVSAFAATCFIFSYGPPVLMRASILAFFALGMIVRRLEIEKRITGWPLGAALLPFCLIMPLKLYLSLDAVNPLWDNQGRPMAAIDMVTRVAAAIAFWRIAWALAGSRAAPPLKRIEPYMFMMFCAHLIIIWTLAPVVGAWVGPLGSPGYPAFLLLHPLLALGLTMLVARLLQRVAPGAAAVLSGGRLGRKLTGA